MKIQYPDSRLFFLISILLPLLLMIVSYWLFGFYFESNDDQQMALIFDGRMSTRPESNLFFWHIFTGNLLSAFYQLSPSVPWYGLLMYFFLWCSMINFFAVGFQVFREKCRPGTLVLILITLFFFVIVENILLLNFTRVAILLSGSSILFYIIYYPRSASRTSRILISAWSLSMTSLALFTRLEGAILSLAIIAPLFIVLIGAAKYSWKGPLFFYLAVVLVITGIKVYQASITDPELNQRKNLFQGIVDYDYLSKSENTGPRESAIRSAITNWIFWDKTIMTTEYLKELTGEHGKFSKNTERLLQSIFHLHSVYLIVIIFAENQSFAFMVNLFLIFIPLWTFFSQNNKRHLLFTLFYHAAFWFTFTIVMILFKLPNRVSNPLFVLYTLSNIIVFLQFHDQLINYRKPVIRYTAALLLIAASVIYSYRMINQLEIYRSGSRLNKEKLAEINRLADSTIVVFAAPAIHLLDGSNPFEEIELNKTNTNVFIGGWTTWYPFIDSSLTALTGSNKMLDLFQFFTFTKHLFISDDSHNRVFAQYLEQVYGKKFVFQEVYEQYDTGVFSFGHKSNYYIVTSEIYETK